jgi:hypothetical protein
MEGWISIHRKLLQWEWYTNSNMVHLALHLLLKANHSPASWRGIKLQRGQLVTGRNQLSLETGISPQVIRSCLRRLKDVHFLTIQPTNRYSIITISKYDDYQIPQPAEQPANEPTDNQPATSCQPTSNQQLTTNNNDNNKNNEDNEDKKKEREPLETKSENVSKKNSDSLPASPKPDLEEISTRFAKLCPSLPRVRVMHETRKRNLRSLLNKTTTDQLFEVFQLVSQSDFLTGVNDRGWKADFDWIIKPQNFYKILEGKYSNPKQNEKIKPNDPRASQSAGYHIPL